MTATWTSASKSVIGLILVLFTGLAASQVGQGYYGDDPGIVEKETGFSIPEYDSQEDIVTEFVAPFLLIAIILQIGLERALLFTLATDDRNFFQQLMADDEPYERERRKTRHRSMVLSLIITGMLVPTSFFSYINELSAWIFGGSIYILFILAAIYFVYKLVGGLW